ncbi:unnamed protein product [Closterium sp. NIES-64]|nr:unnamed protein product [Closterium sp. NIES-64]
MSYTLLSSIWHMAGGSRAYGGGKQGIWRGEAAHMAGGSRAYGDGMVALVTGVEGEPRTTQTTGRGGEVDGERRLGRRGEEVKAKRRGEEVRAIGRGSEGSKPSPPLSTPTSFLLLWLSPSIPSTRSLPLCPLPSVSPPRTPPFLSLPSASVPLSFSLCPSPAIASVFGKGGGCVGGRRAGMWGEGGRVCGGKEGGYVGEKRGGMWEEGGRYVVGKE